MFQSRHVRIHNLIIISIVLLLFSNEAISQTEDSLYNLSFEDLIKIPIVAAGKQEQTIAEIPASAVVITRKEIEHWGYRDLRTILNNIPGYYAMSNLGIDIYGVRGYAKGKGNNFIIMVNGTKIMDENILKFYQIPVESIEKIEVIRGPMAVMYGNNAFFGVINIITEKEDYQKDYNNNVNFSYGTWNTLNSAIKLSAQQKELRLNLDLVYMQSDGLDAPLAPMMKRPEKMDDPLFGGPNNDGLNLPEYARRTKNFLNKNDFFMNFIGAYRGFTFNIFYNEAKNKHYYYYPSIDEGSEFINRNITTQLSYEHSFTDKYSLSVKSRYSRYYRHYAYRLLFEGFFGYDIYNIAEFESEANFFWKPVKSLDITLGIQYENMFEYLNEGDVPSAGAQNMYFQILKSGDQAVVGSGFTQISYKPVEKLDILAGVRFEKAYGYGVDLEFDKGLQVPDSLKEHYKGDYPSQGIITLPRAAVIYSFNNHNILKLLYGQAQKRPGVSVIADDVSDIARAEKDAYSEAEFIETYEINYFSFISRKFSFNLSFYLNNLKNLLVERNEIVDDNLRAWWTNTGYMRTKGIELSIKSILLEDFVINFSGTYQNSKDISFNTAGSYSPELILNMKIHYNINDNYIFSLIGNYTSSMKAYFDTKPIFDNDGNPTGRYVGRTSDDVPAYTTFDFNFRWQAEYLKNFYLNANITNLFDTQILYPTFPRNNAWADKGTLGYGRQFYFTLGYKF